MGTRSIVETGRDRKALVADAGFSQVSLTSAIAGVLAAYGAFAVLAGLTVGIVRAANADIDVSAQWQDLGMAGGLVVAGLLFLAYLFGGYVAGRMARRAGAVHGVLVFVLGVAVAVGAAALARWLGGAEVATSNLRDLGVPTTATEWGEIATVAGLASLAAMLIGSLLGGALGERWHAKLVTRALDPRIGAEAEALRDAEVRAAEAEELRSGSFQRVRATTPTRSRRVDSEAERAYAYSDSDTLPTEGAERTQPVRWRREGNEDRTVTMNTLGSGDGNGRNGGRTRGRNSWFRRHQHA